MNEKERKKVMDLALYLAEKGYNSVEIEAAVYGLYPKDSVCKVLAVSILKMFQNFTDTVHKAGGSGWTPVQLEKMTAMGLLQHLSTNHVRFFFDKPKELNGKI